MAHQRRLSDPLTVALLPPSNETPEQRESRAHSEAEARRINDSIEEMLRQDRVDRKKNRPDVSVLLLGQSESGKSTTLKREYSLSLIS